MTAKESAYILAVLRAAYPSFYSGLTADDVRTTVNLWAEMFADDPAAEVSAAVKALVAAKVEGYPPTIGAVKEKLYKLREPDRLDAQSAWALASKAAAGNLEWESLPPAVQGAIGSKAILQAWGAIEIDTFNTVIYSQFVKIFAAGERREKELAVMPEGIKKMICGLADRLAIGEKNDKQQG